MRADRELLEQAAPDQRRRTTDRQAGLAQTLHMRIHRVGRIDAGQIEHLVRNDVRPLEHPMPAHRMAITDAAHHEILANAEIHRHGAAVLQPRLQPSGTSMAAARAEGQRHARVFQREFGAVLQTRQHAGTVPRPAMFIVVRMEEQVPIIEGRRRPQPEELRRDCRLRGLRIGRANRAHTPAAIASAAPAGEIMRHPSGIDLPAPLAALRHARHVHHGAGADAADEARLQDRRGAAGEEQFACDAGVVGRNAEAQFVQRLQHLQRDRANAQIHALPMEDAAGEQAVLLATRQHRNRAIDDVEVRVDAHRHAHHRTAIRRLRAEEIAIIEIAVRP